MDVYVLVILCLMLVVGAIALFDVDSAGEAFVMFGLIVLLVLAVIFQSIDIANDDDTQSPFMKECLDAQSNL